LLKKEIEMNCPRAHYLILKDAGLKNLSKLQQILDNQMEDDREYRIPVELKDHDVPRRHHPSDDEYTKCDVCGALVSEVKPGSLFILPRVVWFEKKAPGAKRVASLAICTDRKACHVRNQDRAKVRADREERERRAEENIRAKADEAVGNMVTFSHIELADVKEDEYW